MSFVKNLAQGGLFGLAGRAIAGSGKKKDRPQPSGSLTTEGRVTPVRPMSLINEKEIY